VEDYRFSNILERGIDSVREQVNRERLAVAGHH
jgi:hypothetical protein